MLVGGGLHRVVRARIGALERPRLKLSRQRSKPLGMVRLT